MDEVLLANKALANNFLNVHLNEIMIGIRDLRRFQWGMNLGTVVLNGVNSFKKMDNISGFEIDFTNPWLK